MKKIKLTIAILIIMMLTMIASVSAIDITTCQNITSPGTYDVVNDLTITDTVNKRCIDIQSDNVILDFDGYSVGKGGFPDPVYGVYSNGYDNIIVNNNNNVLGYDYLYSSIINGNNVTVNNFKGYVLEFATGCSDITVNNAEIYLTFAIYNCPNSNAKIYNLWTNPNTGSNVGLELGGSSGLYFENCSNKVDLDNNGIVTLVIVEANSIDSTSNNNVGWFPKDITQAVTDPFTQAHYEVGNGFEIYYDGMSAPARVDNDTFSTTFAIQPNSAPVINSISPDERTELKNGESQSYIADVTDAESDSTYVWTLGGVEVSTTSTYTANWGDIAPGIYTLTLTVEDAEYSDSLSKTLEIRARGGSASSSGSSSILDDANADSNDRDKVYLVEPKQQTTFDRISLAIGNFFKSLMFWK